MKAHLAKLSLALLSTVFLLGCQDMGSEPVGPEGLGPEFTHKDGHTKGGGGDGGGGGGGGRRVVTLENVTVAAGMKTNPETAVQQMELVRKGDIVKLRGLASELGEPYFFLKIDMTKTYLAGWRNICETGHGDTAEELMDDVFLNLLKSEAERTVFVVIDKSALASGDHQIEVGGPGLVAVRPSTVVISGDINSDSFSATFSGGRVKVGGTTLTPSAPNKFASELFCDNLDEITFTVGGG